MNEAVERVVAYLYDQYDQPISLSDMADVAMLSRFHFARVFREETGVSPGRFLSAVRLHHAKGLLVSTSLTVTDISYMVGYNSLGTFTSRFTKSVGVTPLQFRLAGHADLAKPTDDFDDSAQPPTGSLAGWMTLPFGVPELRLYLGAFDTPIAQRLPVACIELADPTAFKMDGVPEGEWYLLAAGVELTDLPVNSYGAPMVSLLAREGPVKVVGGETTMVSLAMRAARPTDPPRLLALPGLEGSRPGPGAGSRPGPGAGSRPGPGAG